jgi:cytochrome c6
MRIRAFAAVAMIAMTACAAIAFADADKRGIDGKKGFEDHCAMCHIDGGNVINPEKTLSEKDRLANGVKSAEDIIGKMRHPGPGMMQFDEKTISDNEARAIADYIMKTFK